MKRTLVKDIPTNAISRNELLQRKYPLIGFEVIGTPGDPPQSVGFLVPTGYFNAIFRSGGADRYVARSIRGFGYGNGWGGDFVNKGKTLTEWLDWFANLDILHMHVFDSEKELFFFLAEKSK